MLSELKSRHRDIARLKVEGYKPAEIADKLDLPIQTVYNIQRDPLFRQHTAKLHDSVDSSVVNVRKELAKLQVKALNVLDDTLTDDKVSPRTRLSAAKDVLDRTGHVAPKHHVHDHTVITAEDLELLKARAISAGATMIEAEYEEVD